MALKNRPGDRISTSAVFPITILAHLLFIAVTALVLVWLLKFRGGVAFSADNKQKIFNLHPLFMVIGFLLIPGEAMMVYWSIPAERKTQKVVHMVLNFVAFVAAIIGTYGVFKYHNDLNLPDMYSLHSWLGMCAICLFGLQWLFGFAVFFFPGGKMETRAKFSPWHILTGLVIFLLMIVSTLTGLVEKFIFQGLRRSQEALVINFTGLLIFLFGLSVLLTVLNRYWH